MGPHESWTARAWLETDAGVCGRAGEGPPSALAPAPGCCGCRGGVRCDRAVVPPPPPPPLLLGRGPLPPLALRRGPVLLLLPPLGRDVPAPPLPAYGTGSRTTHVMICQCDLHSSLLFGLAAPIGDLGE